MYQIIWRFRLRKGAERQFLAGYSANGRWAQLFRRAAGFEHTELARSVEDDRSFYTIDFWQSREAFEKFRVEFATQYEELDREFSNLTETEQYIGTVVREDVREDENEH